MLYCLCGSEKAYEQCCAPYHQNYNAPSALCLMKSRYSAYALGLEKYLFLTTHPSKRTKGLEADIAFTCKHVTWSGLRILSVWKGEENDTVGKVHFQALFEKEGLKEVHEEHSRFKRFGKVWMYVDGKVA